LNEPLLSKLDGVEQGKTPFLDMMLLRSTFES
jgi:hypothetical protein